MDFMDDLETLRAEYDALKRAQASLSLNPLGGHDEFDEELLRVEMGTPRRKLVTLFPRIGLIEDRMALQDFSIKVRQMEKLVTLVGLEMMLTERLPATMADDVATGLKNDTHTLASSFKQAHQSWEDNSLLVSPYQVEGDENFDPALLGQRFKWVERIMSTSRQIMPFVEPHLHKDEILLLDDLHDTRLEYAALHAERAQMLLEHANDMLLQRARAANAVYGYVLDKDDRLIKNPENLMSYSEEWGEKASQILFRLRQFYQAMDQSGHQSGAVFHVQKYVPINVSFDFMS